MSILTPNDLSDAIGASLGLDTTSAQRKAETLLDLFGFETWLVDNVLEPDERQLCYALQGAGLLSVKSEETNLYNGQTWRSHYWVLKNERIQTMAEEAREERAAAARRKADLYLNLPESVWART